jgi:hypothetical protein
MTTANGTYIDCGYGQGFSISLWCSGDSCDAFSAFPWLQCTNSSNIFHCTNGVDCSGSGSNFTSVFSFTQTDVNVSSNQQLNIDGKYFVIDQDTSGEVLSKATSSSSTIRIPRLLLFVLAFISLLSGVMGQLSAAEVIQDIENKIPSQFQQYIPSIEGSVCAWVEENIVVNSQGKSTELLQADFVSYCVWVTEGIDSSPTVGETEAHTRFLARFGNLWLCNKLAGLIVSADASVTESVALQHLCGDFILDIGHNSATTNTTTTATPLPTSTGTTIQLPGATDLSSHPCVACYLSGLFGSRLTSVDCSTPVVAAAVLSGFFCLRGIAGINDYYGGLCESLCGNPCDTFDARTWIAQAGSGYLANTTLAADCDEVCADVEEGSSSELICTSILPDGTQFDACGGCTS